LKRAKVFGEEYVHESLELLEYVLYLREVAVSSLDHNDAFLCELNGKRAEFFAIGGGLGVVFGELVSFFGNGELEVEDDSSDSNIAINAIKAERFASFFKREGVITLDVI
jgi:hypothetical protein